jgi:hypothetical protein
LKLWPSGAANGATALARRTPLSQSSTHVGFMHRCFRKSMGWEFCSRHCVRKSVPSATNSRQDASAGIVRGCRPDRNSLTLRAPQALAERSGFLLLAPLRKSFTHFLS